MQESLNQVGNDIAVELLSWLRESKTFILDQAPQVIQQKLAYDAWANQIGVILFVALFLIGLGMLIWGIRYAIKSDYYGAPEIPLIVFGAFFTLGGALGTASCAFSLAKITKAPKVYIVESLKGWR